MTIAMFNKLRQLLRSLTGPRSVDSILHSFSRTVADLKATENAKQEEADRLSARAATACKESSRAACVRTKLETLIC
jgi:hypothetical protein